MARLKYSPQSEARRMTSSWQAPLAATAAGAGMPCDVEDERQSTGSAHSTSRGSAQPTGSI